MAAAAPIIGAISGIAQVGGNIAGKNAADQKGRQAQQAFDPMKDIAQRLGGGRGAYTPQLEGLAGQLGQNRYGGSQMEALQGMGNNPFSGQIQDLLAQGQNAQYAGNTANIASQLQNIGQGDDANAMRSALGGMANNPYAGRLEGLANQLAGPADNTNLEAATGYQFRELQKRLSAAGASRGAMGSSMVGQDLARGGAELYGGLAKDISQNALQRNQLQAGLLQGLGQDQFARGQAQAAGYGNLAQLGAAGLQGAAGLYQGLDNAALQRNQFALGGLQGLGADQFARQQGLFSGYSSMNQQDLARQQAQFGAYQGMNQEELQRLMGAAGLYGQLGQAYLGQSQHQPNYNLGFLPGMFQQPQGAGAPSLPAQDWYPQYQWGGGTGRDFRRNTQMM